MQLIIKKTALYISTIFCFGLVQAQTAEQIFKAAGSPAKPKVNVSWNRYYDYGGITDICKKIAAAFRKEA